MTTKTEIKSPKKKITKKKVKKPAKKPVKKVKKSTKKVSKKPRVKTAKPAENEALNGDVVVPPKKRGRPRKDAPKKVTIKSEVFELTDREERFCREYVCDAALNATKSYQRAFPATSYYSAKTEASKLLAKPYIKARIKEMQQERAARLEITPERILAEAAKIAFYDPRNFWDDDGRLKPIGELDPDHAAVVGGIETLHKIMGEESDGLAITTKIKLPDKRAALDMLGKYMKLFTDATPAPVKYVAEMLELVLSGELSAREAAYKLQIKGIPLPKILEIELSKNEAPKPPEDRPPLTPEELDRKYEESIAAVNAQHQEFLPERREEVRLLKEEMKQIEQFGPDGEPVGEE